MTKILLLIIAVLVSLCGCSKDASIKPVTENLIFKISAEWENESYEFSASTDENSTLYLTVISPQVNQNLKYKIAKDKVTLNYLELEKQLPLSSFSAASPIRVLGEMLIKIKSTDAIPITENNQCNLSFKVESQEFCLLLGQTGLPLELKNQNDNNSIIFKEMTIEN